MPPASNLASLSSSSVPSTPPDVSNQMLWLLFSKPCGGCPAWSKVQIPALPLRDSYQHPSSHVSHHCLLLAAPAFLLFLELAGFSPTSGPVHLPSFTLTALLPHTCRTASLILFRSLLDITCSEGTSVMTLSFSAHTREKENAPVSASFLGELSSQHSSNDVFLFRNERT